VIEGLLAIVAAAAAGAASPEVTVPAAVAGMVAPTSKLPVVAAVERLTLPPLRRPIELVVDPLGARIELRTPEAPRLAQRLRAVAGSICPRVEHTATAVVMGCNTRRLDAELTTELGKTYLDLRALRGLPFRGPDQELPVFYDPLRLHLGDACPGRTPAVRGECLLAAGKKAEAALQFRLAVDTPERFLAILRLGDLALAAGQVKGALEMYLRVGSSGAFGRLAGARICELTGECLTRQRMFEFEVGGLTEPVVTELKLRGARVDTFLGRVPSAIQRLDAVLSGGAGVNFCDEVGLRFCRRLVLDLLQRSGKETGLPALEVYLALPRHTEGPLAFELGRAAGERAAALGAPVFGANLMASVFAAVPPDEMREYLLHTAELYAEGHDRPRTRLILDYAESRFKPRQMSDPRWVALRARLRGVDDHQHVVLPADDRALEELASSVALDVANAFGILARARADQL
jgi:hypothetical protein